jgi:uncharacterized protein
MRVWLDILTPKQLLFLGELGRRLRTKGYEVFNTTRNYKEVNELVDMKGFDCVSVGRHGGSTLKGKLVASANRIAELANLVSKLKPDLSVAFASPEAARTAFGLSIPHYTVNDSPHSVSVARLTIPLSKRLFTPKIIPKNEWIKLGADPDMIVQYNALDPIAWLRNFASSPAVLYQLGLDGSKPIVTFRVEEVFASYLLDKVHQNESVVTPIIRSLLERYRKEVQIVIIPRYSEQINMLEAAFHDQVTVTEKVIDSTSLLFFSSLFVGAGGTMTAEAALLGTPAISCYPVEPTIVEQFLIREKAICRILNPDKAFKKITHILDNFENYKKLSQEKAAHLLSTMEDPIDVIISHIERDFKS